MLQHRMHHNPFSSPPSSTGSHDTVSTTTEELSQNLSNFSFSPDGEGTRVFGEDLQQPSNRRAARSGRFGSKQMHETILNTSAIARTFPEWSGLVARDNATVTQTIDMAAPFKPVSASPGGKENMPPTQERAEENTFEIMADAKRKRSRADLQARVENESDCSTVLSLSPARPVSGARRSRFAVAQPDATPSPDVPKRSLQDVASKIRTEKKTAEGGTTPSRPSALQPSHETPAHNPAPDSSMVTATSRSFFLPSFRHLPDWTSGTLKFSTMKNGVPVFVRSGKSGVRLDQYGKEHADVHAVGIPKEDEEIFVSMDKLQEEVRELHDHDAMLQREAERLQREVYQLQAELKRLKSQKLSDSAIGSESEASFRRSGGHDQNLEHEIAELRERLDQASRQVGVHDIHSAALAAERDEALHQASVARERATKLQAELEATQKDLESSLNLLRERETLQLENDKLRRELSGVQKDLRATREELDSVRKQFEAAQEEKRQLAQDHASMERNNESYFKENKKLQAQVAARDQHIADLKKGISSRDKMLENIQGLTTDTAALELNAELQAEIERLQKRVEQQRAELHQKDGDISAKEGRIRSLKEQNLDLSIDNERLREENQRLRTEHEEIRSQWVEERHKVVRLNQLLGRNTVPETADDCVRLDDDFKQREAALRQKLERREAAVKKVKQLSSKISKIAEQEFIGKTVKVTRIVEPTGMQNVTEETTGKSSAVNVDEDPTRELHLSDDSEFASVMEAAKATQSKAQLPGILKKPSQPAFEDDTGRFSVKSALSIVSHHSDDEVLDTVHSRKSSMSTAQPELPRPRSRMRRDSEADRDATEPNMTSAFFMPDITLEGNKQGTAKDLPQQALPTLSKDARRVLDGICQHNSINCNVCVRIATHGERIAANSTVTSTKKILITEEDVRRGKKTVSADKPIPVSDRAPEQPPASAHQQHPNSDEPTVRPSMPPGEALAVLIKETQDEIDHLQMELKRLNEVYCGLDKSQGMRERRRVMADIKRLLGELEAKSGHLYRLHDVLEGQKQAGQLMEDGQVDVTVLSGLVRAEVAGESRAVAEEWNGFD
ncbi:2278be2d-aed8-48fa-9fe2-b86318217e26 [Thermothielavioides terrestris]|uniref:2278be2d-aed8-48fa-9fe2-b86318217e26 n=1 Tax=Thermothielavioides terrestris TaxID=2587410 RepID=A0A3S4AHZ0_9PEZI|nr:2278be2d-aed8-48fa-9fe2-b86318217e26 [Thermothielavioides terrestris]